VTVFRDGKTALFGTYSCLSDPPQLRLLGIDRFHLLSATLFPVSLCSLPPTVNSTSPFEMTQVVLVGEPFDSSKGILPTHKLRIGCASNRVGSYNFSFLFFSPSGRTPCFELPGMRPSYLNNFSSVKVESLAGAGGQRSVSLLNHPFLEKASGPPSLPTSCDFKLADSLIFG